MTDVTRPPSGVESQPRGRVVPLAEAAKRLGNDRRTVISRIKAGTIRGGAQPGKQRLRWYVYADQLPGDPTSAAEDSSVVADLLGKLATEREANRLLLAAQANLQSGNEGYRKLVESYREVVESFRLAAEQNRDALALMMAPKHPGDLGT